VNDEPALSGDGEMLFFVSNRPQDGSGEAQRMPDIWLVKRNGTVWGEPQNIGSPINTDGVEAQPFFSSDNRLYFGRMDGIYFSNYCDGTFSEPVKLSDEIFQGRVRGICLSPDNEILIVHSDRPGGFGGWDLYCSFKDGQGNWMELNNMGSAINTEEPEANATFSRDGKCLFFSRSGDIYWVSSKIIVRPPFREGLKPKEQSE
jgi:Tol biopolymer transport system component